MYKLTNTNSIIRTSDNASIPMSDGNRDYREYLKWLDEGNTPQPADPPPTPDYEAMRRQAYTAESDPIFFKWQRGEATEQEWLDKVAEIKARYSEA